MADGRIATIIKEIQYWKQHKLLPEVYCDYLLALYTHGEDTNEMVAKQKKRLKMVLGFHIIMLMLLVPFSLLVTYSTQFQPTLQLGILFLFTAYTFWMYMVFKKNQHQLFYLPFGVLLMLILLFTVYLTKFFVINHLLTIGVLCINFLVWFLLGRKLRFKYLMLSSVIGIIITSIYIVL